VQQPLLVKSIKPPERIFEKMESSGNGDVVPVLLIEISSAERRRDINSFRNYSAWSIVAVFAPCLESLQQTTVFLSMSDQCCHQKSNRHTFMNRRATATSSLADLIVWSFRRNRSSLTARGCPVVVSTPTKTHPNVPKPRLL